MLLRGQTEAGLKRSLRGVGGQAPSEAGSAGLDAFDAHDAATEGAAVEIADLKARLAAAEADLVRWFTPTHSTCN